jgi:hypothetical protein
VPWFDSTGYEQAHLLHVIVQFRQIARMSASRAEYWAVLIADVVRSSSRPDLRGILGAKLRQASRMHRGFLKLSYSVTAGDEFQAIGLNPALMRELLFDLRRWLQPQRPA